MADHGGVPAEILDSLGYFWSFTPDRRDLVDENAALRCQFGPYEQVPLRWCMAERVSEDSEL
ncbi:hypothetical protein AB0J43_02500 [Nonomuraea fuscirosea]